MFPDPLPAEALFGEPNRAPLVLVKRRRRIDSAASPPAAPDAADADRRPRVFVLRAAQGDAVAPVAEPAGPVAPPGMAVARRRARRDPLRQPGAVVHIVAPAAAPQPPADVADGAEADDGLGFELGDDDYPKVVAALQAVQRLLDEAATAARLQLTLQAALTAS